jgi:flavin reductase (DIM6/NTAB) family NADH-FMN oxidoreductase RutF/catechol 2,3-dioxygenase-like lactoylglutathione lyase family enzyme
MKVQVPVDKKRWHPSPLPGQVVLVTTLAPDGRPSVATKSWISMAAFGPPPILMFGCNSTHATAKHIVDQGEFVINVPGAGLRQKCWAVGSDCAIRGVDRFSVNDLTPIPSLAVGPPRIAECRAHLECNLEHVQSWGDEVTIFGQVVAASVDASALVGDEETRYRTLDPFFFLEADWAAGLGRPTQVDRPPFGPAHSLTIIAVSDLDRSVTFYRDAFGWPIKIDSPVYVEFDLPDGRGLGLYDRLSFGRNTGIVPEPIADDAITGTELYLHCVDLGSAVARLQAAGARELSARAKRDWGDEAAYFADRDGNVLVVACPLDHND